MKKLVALVALTLVSASALADVYVPYGPSWTTLPNCGGRTRLICPNVALARQTNQCRIEFDSSYNCRLVNLYTNARFAPKLKTVPEPLRGSFWVDNSRINSSLNFRVFLTNPDGSLYEKITYQFAY